MFKPSVFKPLPYLNDEVSSLQGWVQYQMVCHRARAGKGEHMAVLEATYCQEVLVAGVARDAQHCERDGGRGKPLKHTEMCMP